MSKATIHLFYHANIPPQGNYSLLINQQLEFKELTGAHAVASADPGNRARINQGHLMKWSSAGGSGRLPAGVSHISDILPSILNNIKERQVKR